jgi:hypothetical protein
MVGTVCFSFYEHILYGRIGSESQKMPSTQLYIYYVVYSYVFQSQRAIRLGAKNVYKQENKI